MNCRFKPILDPPELVRECVRVIPPWARCPRLGAGIMIMEEEGEEVFAAGDSDGKGVSVAFDAPTQHRLAGPALTFEHWDAGLLVWGMVGTQRGLTRYTRENRPTFITLS